METFQLNSTAAGVVGEAAEGAGLSTEQVMSAAVQLASQASPEELAEAAKAARDTKAKAEPITGRDWVRIGILIGLALLFVVAIGIAFWAAAPRHMSAASAIELCKASQAATGAKTCDPAALITQHNSDWLARLTSLVTLFALPLLTALVGSIGYYFGNASEGSTGGTGA